jgi:aryl-alcohol dehydrogenase-like predicted oxidoreductase
VLATGRVDAWGVVNWSAEALAAAGDEAQTLGLAQPCAVQLPYSLARTDWVEDPAMERALADTGASLILSAVLAGGALSGKYAEGQTGRLSGELDAAALRRAFELGAALREPAQRQGVSLPRWPSPSPSGIPGRRRHSSERRGPSRSTRRCRRWN